jgi:hypothetical protein
MPLTRTMETARIPRRFLKPERVEDRLAPAV